MDPREYGPQQRRANLSELMAAQMRASKGEKVNFCMFGCDDSDLDDNGYCRHVVGFTKDGKVMEPFLPPDGSGRRKVLGSRPEPTSSSASRRTPGSTGNSRPCRTN
jgi:hypothetical protein